MSPSWKKIITSGSNALLSSVTTTGNISGSSTSTGSFGHLTIDGGAIIEGKGTGNNEREVLVIRDHDGSDNAGIYFKNSGGATLSAIGHLGASGRFSVYNKPIAIAEGAYIGGNSTIGGGLKLHVEGDSFFTGNISGSATSTGSFGRVYVDQSTLTTAQNTDVDIGTEEIVGFSTGSFSCAFFDYVISSGSSNMRAGTVMSVWNSADVKYTDTSTTDIGDTSGLKFATTLTSSMAVLRATAASDNWTVKTLVRTI